ncbi:hypothetical protein C7N43_26345, partial [Sphingobacteriales bacterium UPWRP_1]
MMLLSQTDETYEPNNCMGMIEEDENTGQEGLQLDPTTADPNTMYDPNTGMVYLENATIKQAKIAVAN